MKDSDIVLLATDHCTLCEAALELLFSMPELRGLSLRVLDIENDDTLLAAYGERVPVLRVGAQELQWPFDRSGVLRLLREREQD